MGFLGDSRKKAWEEFSREINAKYIDRGFWRGDRIEFNFKNWLFVLDTYAVSTGKSSVTYTRIRSPFVKRENFYFRIYRKGIFSSISKFFGAQDIKIDDYELDEQFMIKGNQENKIRELLSHVNIKKYILEQPSIDLCIKNDEGFFGSQFPYNINELYFQTPSVIKDVNRLKSLFYLFCEVLTALCEMDIISSEKAEINLK